MGIILSLEMSREFILASHLPNIAPSVHSLQIKICFLKMADNWKIISGFNEYLIKNHTSYLKHF